jgi:transcriptional regulator with XRE-family HTH domain
MIRQNIQRELDQRGWSVLKLANETGIRYPSLSEYFAGKKELNTKNLEIVLKTLNLNIMKKTEGNRIPDYENLIKSFDGKKLINYDTEMEISEIDFANFLFGTLVQKAGKYLGKEMKGDLNYGDIYDRFVQKVRIDSKMVLDIPLSCQKREFVRIAQEYFSETEKQAYSVLCGIQYPEKCNREYLETQFVCGLFGSVVLPELK